MGLLRRQVLDHSVFIARSSINFFSQHIKQYASFCKKQPAVSVDIFCWSPQCLSKFNGTYISVAIFQNKLMEEKNTVLMQTNVGLEEELRKANATKGQLETYKRQVANQQPCWLSHAVIIIYVAPDWATACSSRTHICIFLEMLSSHYLPCLHRWSSFRTDCRKSRKRLTRWSLSTNVSKRRWTRYKKKKM